MAYDIQNLISNTMRNFILVPGAPTVGKLMTEIGIFQLGTPPGSGTQGKPGRQREYSMRPIGFVFCFDRLGVANR